MMVLLAGGAALSGCGLTFACSCACDGSSSTDWWIDESSAIFIGRVVDISDLSNPVVEGTDGEQIEIISSCGQDAIRVDVARTLKGVVPTRATLIRSVIGTPCDFRFRLKPGREYLFFAKLRSSDGSLAVTGCSPTRRATGAKALIASIEARLGMRE